MPLLRKVFLKSYGLLCFEFSTCSHSTLIVFVLGFYYYVKITTNPQSWYQYILKPLYSKFLPDVSWLKRIVVMLQTVASTAQKMKFSIKDFFNKCDQIRSFLQIWSHFLKKSLMENFIFCTVQFYVVSSNNIHAKAVSKNGSNRYDAPLQCKMNMTR